MEDQDVSVTLKLSQWQFAVDALSRAPIPWAQSNGIISEIITTCRKAAEPAEQTQEAAE